MIDRLEDINSDWTDNYSANTPEIVAQQCKTRLLLWLGEWFLDTSDGTPYLQDILGTHTNYDLEIQNRILATEGVIELTSYSSSISTARALSVNCSINTVHGSTSLSITIG